MKDTEQFWRGEFGDLYSDRNVGKKMIASNTALFSKILARTTGVESVIELGANIGMNMAALRCLLPEAKLTGLEINRKAFDQLVIQPWVTTAIFTSILTWFPSCKWDMSFTKGVLIHIAPEDLSIAYAALYNASSKYICISEYHNPVPVELTYRGNEGRMFKRDFAAEMLDNYKDLRVVDYWFSWKRDPNFPQDDLLTVLLEKT